jgi:hypothetical protein
MVLIKLEDGRLVQCYLSDSEIVVDGCDSCLGYDLYDSDGLSIDGGEYEFNSKDKHVLDNLVEFITEKKCTKYQVLLGTDDYSYGSIMELAEEELDTSFKATVFINKLDSELLKSKIRELCKKMRR